VLRHSQIYECLITMDLEVELVWKSQWKLKKVLYLVNRYVIIADAIILELRKSLFTAEISAYLEQLIIMVERLFWDRRIFVQTDSLCGGR
jgi:hypothetical protein